MPASCWTIQQQSLVLTTWAPVTLLHVIRWRSAFGCGAETGTFGSVQPIFPERKTAADAESRKINLDAEWKLDKAVLEQALAQLQASPSIDLFASRLNNQRSCYVSYRADPEAHAVDAFSLSWTVLEFYAFPPFSLITRVLQKVKRDRSTGVIIVPTWPTQVWWPVLMKMITGKPVQLASRVTLLTLPSHPEKRHRLLPRLKLLACKISGADTNNRDTPGVQLISC